MPVPPSTSTARATAVSRRRAVVESTRAEILIGRSAALCAHPFLAWRLSSRATRACIAAAYSVLAYLTVLAALVATR
jgi:hypothetical protein